MSDLDCSEISPIASLISSSPFYHFTILLNAYIHYTSGQWISSIHSFRGSSRPCPRN